MSDAHLVVETSDGIRTITIDRPDARNALLLSMRHRLKDLFAEAAADDDVAVIVLTGTDPAFCAGIDIKEWRERDPRRVNEEITDPAAALRTVGKPVIGAINGVCVGGGLELALACDLLIASERARFSDPHVSLGLVPAWGMTALLARAVQTRKAIELSLTGRFVDAKEALSAGLVNDVVAHDELTQSSRDLATVLCRADPIAARTVLGVYRRAAGLPFEEALDVERDAWRNWRLDVFGAGKTDRQ